MVDEKDNNSNPKIDANKNRQEISDNSGMRAAQITSNPSIGLEEARNANEGKPGNASGGIASSTAEEHVPSSSDPEPSDLPSAS